MGDEASAIAKVAAQADPGNRPVDADAAKWQARTLRFTAMLALQKAMNAHASLSEAVRAVLEDGTGVDGEVLPYPDDEALFDAVNMAGIAYSTVTRWFAAMEGKESLAQLMLNGPPGFEPEELRGADGSVWWTLPDPDELKDGDGNIYGRDFVVRECGGLLPVSLVNSSLPSRAVVGSDGLMLLLTRPTVFGPGYMSEVEHKHGPLFEVEFFELQPDGMVEVKTVDGELKLRMRPQDARDPRRVHAWLMEARQSLRQGVELGERMVAETPGRGDCGA